MASVDYDYTPSIGTLAAKTIGPAGVAGAGTHTYSYDRLERLVAWQAPGASNVLYEYDGRGNRTKVGPTGSQTTYAFDARNRLTTVTPPSGPVTTNVWRPRGVLQSKTVGAAVTNYTFDQLGRLTQEGATTYTYDGLDRIVKRNAAATDFKYSGLSIDPASDGTTTILRSPGGKPLTVKNGASAPQVPITNSHGDVTTMLNTSGAVASSRSFSPYGEIDASVGSGPVIGFQGDYTDPTTANVWMGARWYNPSLDSFLSRDTYPGTLDSPVSLNRYTYAGNNPNKYFDPDGHMYDGGGAGGTCPNGTHSEMSIFGHPWCAPDPHPQPHGPPPDRLDPLPSCTSNQHMDRGFDGKMYCYENLPPPPAGGNGGPPPQPSHCLDGSIYYPNPSGGFTCGSDIKRCPNPDHCAASPDSRTVVVNPGCYTADHCPGSDAARPHPANPGCYSADRCPGVNTSRPGACVYCGIAAVPEPSAYAPSHDPNAPCPVGQERLGFDGENIGWLLDELDNDASAYACTTSPSWREVGGMVGGFVEQRDLR